MYWILYSKHTIIVIIYVKKCAKIQTIIILKQAMLNNERGSPLMLSIVLNQI